MATILDEIVENTRKEVAERKNRVSLSQLQEKKHYSRTPYVLADYIVDPAKSGIITEIKKKSPSKGLINPMLIPAKVAIGYERNGASAISVLTDYKYFGGTMLDLSDVREAVTIPILRKDFMVDEYQVHEAKAIGADAILLIAACLSPEEIKGLAQVAKDLGLSVLLEVHNQEELERSLQPGIDVVGVNNRNLKTFEVNIDNSILLAAKMPKDVVKISESGLKDAHTILRLKEAGYQGFLIGESFMKTTNPGEAFGELVKDIKRYQNA
jgi:indole-3-glycerol phosphate synthase